MTTKEKYVQLDAVISSDLRYRYVLRREWRDMQHRHWRYLRDERGDILLDGTGERLGWPKSCVFIMLNPSTADGEEDDPTIRRCVGFAKREGYERLVVVNLFAYRATDPKEILGMNDEEDPIGPENRYHVESECGSDAGLIIGAWGGYGSYLRQAETVRGWIDPRHKLYCLGFTKSGFPRHPLYVRGDTELVLLP